MGSIGSTCTSLPGARCGRGRRNRRRRRWKTKAEGEGEAASAGDVGRAGTRRRWRGGGGGAGGWTTRGSRWRARRRRLQPAERTEKRGYRGGARQQEVAYHQGTAGNRLAAGRRRAAGVAEARAGPVVCGGATGSAERGGRQGETRMAAGAEGDEKGGEPQEVDERRRTAGPNALAGGGGGVGVLRVARDDETRWCGSARRAGICVRRDEGCGGRGCGARGRGGGRGGGRGS